MSTASDVKPNETRALGWYAVRWLNVTEWFKEYRSRTKKLNHKQTLEETKAKSNSEKPEAKKVSKAEARLKDVVEESQSILARASAIPPLQIFPDVITIDRHKLTIVYRKFFNVGQTVSVPIENIKNIQADFGPFFGTLTVTSDLFINNTQTVKNLHREDVTKIQRLIQGAMVAIKENIDITKIETKRLRELLMKLGEGHTGVLKS